MAIILSIDVAKKWEFLDPRNLRKDKEILKKWLGFVVFKRDILLKETSGCNESLKGYAGKCEGVWFPFTKVSLTETNELLKTTKNMVKYMETYLREMKESYLEEVK